VNPKVPDGCTLLTTAVGVPLSTPAAESEIPAGGVPAVIDHVSGKVPPVAASVWAKAELTVAVESGEAVEITGAALMMTANAWLAVFEALSVACNVKLEVAAVAGVPVITHVVPL